MPKTLASDAATRGTANGGPRAAVYAVGVYDGVISYVRHKMLGDGTKRSDVRNTQGREGCRDQYRTRELLPFEPTPRREPSERPRDQCRVATKLAACTRS